MSFSQFIASHEAVAATPVKATHLTPTHVFIDDAQLRVSAWQYQRSAAMPLWVFRKFHQLGDGSALTSIAGDGSLISCLEGDWIVAFDNFPCGYAAVVLSPSEFTRCFVRL